ncbi:hypothetical protein V9T40_002583 [Parthenolecanium corni]|uniref:Ubiquitin-like protease family profile domain-containing protein n=1 Tax=Parthenolecanium corni TaxID=536013 RepID=A0AAN9Y5H7_9HEMI
MEETSEKRILEEVNRWLSNHENDENLSEKVHRYRSLLQTNRMLDSKLKKLKLLYEKKNTQYEAMKAALDLEQDLYDADLETIISTPLPAEAGSHSKFAELTARMRRITSTQKKQEFFLDIITKFSDILGNVKEHAMNGHITDDIIDSCMQIFAQEHPHVLFVPTSVMPNILISATDKVVFEVLDRLKASEYNSCFFVLCQDIPTGPRKHWSLLLYSKNPLNNGIFHYDSSLNENRELARKFSSLVFVYFNTPKFFEVRCVQQEKVGESGLYVIENMTKLLPMLQTGKMTVDSVEISLDNISLLKVFPQKCRVLVMKLHLQRKLQIFLESVLS